MAFTMRGIPASVYSTVCFSSNNDQQVRQPACQDVSQPTSLQVSQPVIQPSSLSASKYCFASLSAHYIIIFTVNSRHTIGRTVFFMLRNSSTNYCAKPEGRSSYCILALQGIKIHQWRQSIVRTVDSDLRIYCFYTGQVGHNIQVLPRHCTANVSWLSHAGY